MENDMLSAHQMRLAAKDYKRLQRGNPALIVTRRGLVINRIKQANMLNFTASIGFRVYVRDYVDAHTDLNLIDATRRAKCFYRRFSEEQREQFRLKYPGYNSRMQVSQPGMSDSSFGMVEIDQPRSQVPNYRSRKSSHVPTSSESVESQKGSSDEQQYTEVSTEHSHYEGRGQRSASEEASEETSHPRSTQESSHDYSAPKQEEESSAETLQCNNSQEPQSSSTNSSSSRGSMKYGSNTAAKIPTAAIAAQVASAPSKVSQASGPRNQPRTNNRSSSLAAEANLRSTQNNQSGNSNQRTCPSRAAQSSNVKKGFLQFTCKNLGFLNYFRNFLFYHVDSEKRDALKQAIKIYATFDSDKRLVYENMGNDFVLVPKTESGKDVGFDC